MIEIPLGKGCYLLLTDQEYKSGIQRGKAKRRRQAFEARALEHQLGGASDWLSDALLQAIDKER